MHFKHKLTLAGLVLLVWPVFAMAAEIKTVHLQALAEKGDPEAQYLLGRHYLSGSAGSQDFIKAEHWYRLSAGQEYPKGIFGLAQILDRRAKTNGDEIEIVRLLKKAADKGIPGAQYYLAWYTLNEKGNLAMDIPTASRLLRQAGAQFYTEANVLLVKLSAKGRCDSDTGNTALKMLETQAKKGNAGAQYYLGTINEKGLTLPVNHKKALFWYKGASEKGYAVAFTRMGQMYESGNGTKRDIKKAQQAYMTAVKKGDLNANWNIARMYEQGTGVSKDKITAARYYHKAAQNGHLESMTAYGNMLVQGIGVPKNNIAAATWLEFAAKRGDADAQYSLAKMYDKGKIRQRPVEQDPNVSWHKKKTWKPGGFDRHWSKYWYEKAAAQGHEEAIHYLERDKTFMGWLKLAGGIFFIPFSILGFLIPQIFLIGRHRNSSPLLARWVGAPAVFLIGIYLLVDGIRSLF